MTKKTKIGLITLGVILLGMILFNGVDFYGLRDYNALLPNADKITLKEQPAQVTYKELDDRGVSCSRRDGRLFIASGDFVPYNISGKKRACTAALSFMELLALDDGCELRYAGDLCKLFGGWSLLAGVHLYEFTQYYKDIPVYGGILTMETGRFGKPDQLYSNLVYGIPADLPTEPQITAEEAIRKAALAEMNEPDQGQTPPLVIILDNNDRAALAWLVMIEYEPAAVNAVTGEMLEIDSLNQYYEDD